LFNVVSVSIADLQSEFESIEWLLDESAAPSTTSCSTVTWLNGCWLSLPLLFNYFLFNCSASSLFFGSVLLHLVQTCSITSFGSLLCLLQALLLYLLQTFATVITSLDLDELWGRNCGRNICRGFAVLG
jgi:ABC-type phosphate/phosphonate transport system permease subunit